MRFPLLMLTFLLTLSAAPAHAAEQFVKLGGMDVAVWQPQTPRQGKSPVIIFSHGFHGCSTQSKFLMDAFAKDGYFVFAPNHKDATCAHGAARWRDRAETPFGRPDEWNDETFQDRHDDIVRLIDAIKDDPRYDNLINWSELGLAGHSLGGYTVLALGGAWPEWKLPGVKAILAMSPYAQPFVRDNTLSGLAAPVMYQGGTRDVGITPVLKKTDGAYDLSPTPKYFIEFARASHFAWTNMPSNTHDNIELYSLAFMDHYVKGQTADPVLTEELRGVTALRYDSDLGKVASAGNAENP